MWVAVGDGMAVYRCEAALPFLILGVSGRLFGAWETQTSQATFRL